MAIEAVLFDCDGVLVDSEVVGLDDSAAFLATLGFSWSPRDLILKFTGMRDDLFRAELLEGYADILGRAPSAEEAQALYEGLMAARRANLHQMQSVEGAVATVQLVAELGIPRAVASSSRQEHLDPVFEEYRPLFNRRPHVLDHRLQYCLSELR